MNRLPPTGLRSELSSEASLPELSEVLESDMRSWEDNFRVAAEAKGRAEERTEVVLNMVRQKFGEKSASEIATALSRIQSAEALDKVALLLLTCASGNALLAGVREF